MRDNEKLFHSRIFRIYLEYLISELKWTGSRIDEFLAKAGVSKDRINDDTTWFDAEFADKFYQTLLEMTGDSQLAYRAGHFVHRESFSPVMHGLIRGLVDVSLVYRLITRFSGHFSKASSFKNISVSGTSAHIESIPKEGFLERPYMCENRRGMLEGIPRIFGLPEASITETECFHKGGTKCSYHLKWEQRSKWIPIFRVAVLSVLLSYLSAVALGWKLGGLTGAFSIMGGVLLLLRKRLVEQKEELLNHNEMLDQMIRKLERKNQELTLVSQIAQLTHSLARPEDLALTLVRNVCQLLNYDRSILLLIDTEKNVLQVKAHHGFSEDLADLLSHTQFSIRADNASGFFIRVVNTKEPLLISDVLGQVDKLSPRSQAFAKKLGTRSFVAVPLMDEQQNVLGVLGVDNTDTGKILSIADQDLLMTLAEHLGIALHNARLLGQLETHLRKVERSSEQQKLLVEAFKKFVPSDLAIEISSSTSTQDFERKIAQVKKRSVSVLFLDVVGFSKAAEGLPPEEVVEILNTALAIWEPIVREYGGFVDKFTGDGFMAIFEEGEYCRRACHSALALVGSMPQVGEALKLKGYQPIEVGIGINFGPAIIGNVGSRDRLNFTVMGEVVNLASRLESYTRKLGSNTICVSAAVRSRIEEGLKWVDLGQIQIKGYSEAVHAFQLLTHSTAPSFAGSKIEKNLRET